MTIINSNNSNGNVTTTYASSLSGHTVELLSYDLAHTVGARLAVVADTQTNKWIINLNSKAGNTISSIAIDYSQFINAIITNITLDYPNKKIIFYFKDGTSIECDISTLIVNLSYEIAEEATRAQLAEETIRASLATEVERAIQADADLQTAIDEEIVRAKTAEAVINTTLIPKINELAATTAGLTLKLNEETIRATNKENDLSRQLEEEINTRKTAISTLSTKVDAEQTARISGDTTLTSKINIEEQSRISADNTLLTQIAQVATNLTNEIERATTADSDLNIKVTTEATTRKNKDDELVSAIETEKTRAKNAEEALATDIENESIARIAKDTELNERIDSLSTKGRFLSVWDCTIGYPETVPTVDEYEYHTGDYFLVGKTYSESTETQYNKRPYGTKFIRGTISTVKEPNQVNVNDSYVYDGTGNWTLISTPIKTYTFAEIAGDARDNTSIAGYFDIEATAREEALETAKTYTDSIAASTLADAKDYAYNYTNGFTYSQTDINDKDLATLNASKAYTYAASIIDAKDTSILTSAKDYTDTEVAKAGKIDDVKVNNTSVVTDKVANILLKTVNHIPVEGTGNIQIEAVTDYDKLTDIPIVNTDIANLSNPVLNTYYRHIGDTTADYTKGLIYQCLDLTPTFSKLTLNSELLAESALRTAEDTRLQNEKQDKLTAGRNITITEDNIISATSETTVDYNALLYNKPIINQDIDADGFIPTLNTYYKHIANDKVILSEVSSGLDIAVNKAIYKEKLASSTEKQTFIYSQHKWGTPFEVGDIVDGTNIFFDTSTPIIDKSNFTFDEEGNATIVYLEGMPLGITYMEPPYNMIYISYMWGSRGYYLLYAYSSTLDPSQMGLSSWGWYLDDPMRGCEGINSFKAALAAANLPITEAPLGNGNGTVIAKTTIEPQAPGWQHNKIDIDIAEYGFTIQGTPNINDGFKSQLVLSPFIDGTIYNCIQVEPIINYSPIALDYNKQDKLIAGNGITIDQLTSTISCNILTHEIKYIEEP